MAVLPDVDRERIWRGLMRWWSLWREAVAVDNVDLREAVNAADAWIDDNQASYNAALPVAARNNLTVAQKTFVFCAVALARVSIDVLRRVCGEVD